MRKLSDLSEEGKEELALALLLWKDFKKQNDGESWAKAAMQMFEMAEMLGVKKELEYLIPRLPPFKITPKY